MSWRNKEGLTPACYKLSINSFNEAEQESLKIGKIEKLSSSLFRVNLH